MLSSIGLRFRRLVLWSGCLAATRPAAAQSAPAESTTVILSPTLSRPLDPSLGRGRGWRALWTDSVCLANAWAERIAGGLSEFAPEPGPLARIMTARSADGHVYRLLPVDRDPVSAWLGPEARGTIVERIWRDMMATAHPTAPLVAASLYRAVGLDAVQPMLAVLRAAADSNDLVGSPVWIERAPELDRRPYGRFARAVTTQRLLEMYRRDPTTPIAVDRYLASRLLDLVIGDRDRGPDHWLWGLDPHAGAGSRWVPIATRQEEAFLRAEGWSHILLDRYQPSHQVYGPEPPNVAALSARAYDLDRPLLARLDRQAWDSVSSALRAALTDARIEQALAQLPPEHRAASESWLVGGLQGRRAVLPVITDHYYRQIAYYPDVELSDASEAVKVRRGQDGDVELSVTAGGIPTLHRVFRRGETAEVRVHLQGGSDTVRLQGAEHGGVGVRVSSSRGSVRLVRNGPVTRGVVLYARPDRVQLEPAGAVPVVPRDAGRRLRWPALDRPPAPIDWGTTTSPVVKLGVGGDLGLVVGGGLQKVWRGYEQPHYRQRLRASAAFASKPSGVRVEGAFERRDVLLNLHLVAESKYTGIDVVRYFGIGNETQLTREEEFYRAEVHEVSGRVAVEISSHPDLSITVGPSVSFGDTDTSEAVNQLSIDRPYGSGRFDFAALVTRFRYDPSGGGPRFHLQTVLDASYVPGWLDVNRGAFGRVGGEARVHWVPQIHSRFALATRVGGTVIAGDVPFRLAARIGGGPTLRGYDVDRFTGDRGALYGSVEPRVRIARFHVDFLSGELGVLAFGDAGRVWARGETSSTLHGSFGGGIWIAPSLGWLPGQDEVVARIVVAHSSERTIVSVGTGFRF